jgi:guanylate kinase
VKRRLVMNNLFILVGPSASGKTTVEEKLLEEGFFRYVTDTTREIRKGEEHGIHYNFLSVEEFKSRDYANVIEITPEWLYGGSGEELLKLASVDNDSVYSVINIEPSINIKKWIKKNNVPLNVYFIHFDIDKEIRIDLMRKRGENEADIEKRLSREENISVYEKYGEKPDLIIKDLYTSFDTIKEFIRKKKLLSVNLAVDSVVGNKFEFEHSDLPIEEVIEDLKKEGIWKD